GGADIDADRNQRDVVLDPDRVVFQPLLDVDVEVIVVMIGIAVMLVHEIAAQEMVGKGVALFLVVRVVGHSRARSLHCKLETSAPALLWHGRFPSVKTPVV